MTKVLRDIQIDCAHISIREDGIMHIDIQVELDFKIEHSMEIVAARTELAQGNSYPILYTAKKFVLPSPEVRAYVASQGRSELVLADAFVVNSLPQKIVANFYLSINKPVTPTKIFNSKSQAIKWLRGFVKH